MDNNFKQYRLQKGYSLRTIKSQNSYLHRFSSWLVNRRLSIEELDNKKLLECLAWFKENKVNMAALRSCLQAIRIYLDYYVEKGIIEVNPALQIKLQLPPTKPKPQALLSQNIDDIYQWFASIKPQNERQHIVHKRDIVVLGLLLFQGLDSGDLERLRVNDINLHEGSIYVASSHRNAARKLKLESVQILPVQEYLSKIRTKLRFCQKDTDKFFPQSKIQDMVSRLVQQLKKQYPDIVNPRHLRSSVIMNRLRTNHIRQVQYMAGHRYVSATERYRKEDLQDLAGQLNKYHPMK
jgi:integrase/recombinase XerD